MKTTYKFLIGGSIIFLTIIALSLQTLEEKTVFFYTIQELFEKGSTLESQTIRVGALVHKGSIEWEASTLNLSFQITDQKTDLLNDTTVATRTTSNYCEISRDKT